MCSNPLSPFLVGLCKTERKAVIFQANCDSWECEECATRKRSQWAARAILGSKKIRSSGIMPQFITITSRPTYADFAACNAAFPRAWNKFQGRMRRKRKELTYLLIPEKHQNGRLHYHFLTNLGEKKRWVKDNAYLSGFGYIADVQAIKSDGMAAAYISKYIGKGLGATGLPHKFRRVHTSQNWETLPKLDAQSANFDWLVCRTTVSLWSATEQCQKENRTMIEGKTGEYFDYGSTIDSWY